MNWDDLRYFLAVARSGQMLSASRRLGVSQALLSRHIATLEQAVGARLLDRTTRGCTLTDDGRLVLSMAERVEAEVLSSLSSINGQDTVSGTVRIGAPDGFGGAFLAPRLGRFQSVYPDLRVQLVPVPRSFSLSEREADIAIMVGRPKKGRLRVRKLVDYSLSLYASKQYLRNSGTPQNLEALRQHTLIGYVDDLVYSDELNYAREFLPNWRSDIEISTAVGQFEAVSAGAGVGVLHDFMARQNENLVMLFPERSVLRSYWIVWHENLQVAQRLRAVMQILDVLVDEEQNLFANTQ